MSNQNDPKVVNVKVGELQKIGYKNLQEWLKNPDNVYVGRDMTWAVKGAVGSKWQNPFKIKKYGIDECLRLFEKYVTENPALLKDIEELRGKNLGCWCVPHHRCHAEILLKLANNKKIITEENFPTLDKQNAQNTQNKKCVSYKDKIIN